MGVFSHANLTKFDHPQAHLTKFSLCLLRQVRFSHANLTKLGVCFVNPTVNPVDLTNSWENYLDSPCWLDENLFSLRLPACGCESSCRLNELWECGTRVPSVNLTNFKVCQVCSAITCWRTQYPPSWLNKVLFSLRQQAQIRDLWGKWIYIVYVWVRYHSTNSKVC